VGFFDGFIVFRSKRSWEVVETQVRPSVEPFNSRAWWYFNLAFDEVKADSIISGEFSAYGSCDTVQCDKRILLGFGTSSFLPSCD
jgi:hypothetical protein